MEFKHKLVADVFPDTSYENLKYETNIVLNEIFDKTGVSIESDKDNLIDFYTTYLYASAAASFYDWFALGLTVSDDCTMLVSVSKSYTSEYKGKVPFISLNLDNKSIEFDISQNVKEIHKAAMIYSYATKKLKKLPFKRAYDSKYYKIKLDIEEHFKKLANGQQSTLNLDNLLTAEEMKTCESIAKAAALKTYLMKNEIIPFESILRKYPKTYEKLIEVLPKIEAKYNVLKALKIAKEKSKDYNTMIKQRRRNLIRAKIKEKQEYRKLKKEKLKSVKEPDFNM